MIPYYKHEDILFQQSDFSEDLEEKTDDETSNNLLENEDFAITGINISLNKFI